MGNFFAGFLYVQKIPGWEGEKLVVVNGEQKDVADKNLLEFLLGEGYEPSHIVVEINLEIVPREDFSKVTLKDQDMVEVLRFVGGG